MARARRPRVLAAAGRPAPRRLRLLFWLWLLATLLLIRPQCRAAAPAVGRAGLTLTFSVAQQAETRGSEPRKKGPAGPPAPTDAAPLPNDLVGHWARAAVATLASRIDLGLGHEGRFAPEAQVTRAGFVTWLGQLLSVPENSEQAATISGAGPGGAVPRPAFTDVAGGEPWAPYVRSLAAQDLLRGEGNQRFAPARALTRLELMVWAGRLVRWAALSEGARETGETLSPLPNPTLPARLPAYPDGAQIPGWAHSEVEAALAAGIIHGRPDGYLAPQELASRGEAAVVLARLLPWLSPPR